MLLSYESQEHIIVETVLAYQMFKVASISTKVT